MLQYEPLLDVPGMNTEMVTYFQSGGWLTEHKQTRKFEEEIARLTDTKYCYMVSNGTISLSIALMAYGIRPGDEVLVPALTMIATPNAVRLLGAVPVFVDVEADNLCMDFNDMLSKKTDKTKALIYVTLNGRSNKIMDFSCYCRRHNIAYIEDDAQSLGSCYSNLKPIGSKGISSFSFSMPKIITTGQGGCLCTNDDELADNIRRIRDFGREKAGVDIHPYFGINAKFTDLQSVVGLNQLKTFKERVKIKKSLYSLYQQYLSNVPEITWLPTDLTYVTPWFVDIYVGRRDELKKYLAELNIHTREVYPSVPSQKCYDLGYPFPITDKFSKMGLWLPSSMNLTAYDVQIVADKIKAFFSKS